jgi:hypothetical protein
MRSRFCSSPFWAAVNRSPSGMEAHRKYDSREAISQLFNRNRGPSLIGASPSSQRYRNCGVWMMPAIRSLIASGKLAATSPPRSAL